MAIDLLGPAAFGAVRPAATRPAIVPASVPGAADTFMKDCSNALAQDGTQLSAAHWNAFLAQMRGAIRASGVTEDNSDDLMLAKALKVIARHNIAETYTPSRVLSSTTFLAATEYTLATQTIQGATSLIAYASFMALMPAALQADVSPRLRVTRISDNVQIDDSPQAGTIMGQSYVGDARQVIAYSAVNGLNPALSYRVDFIAVANGWAGNLQYFNPFLTITY